jgi:phage terminase Nu1 subunit (DNA packaging protein)
MRVDAAKLCDIHGVDRKTVTNWLNEKPPCPSRIKKRKREFDTVEVGRWLEARAVEKSGGKKQASTATFNDARARKMDLDARLAELELLKAEGQLIPIDMYEREMSAVLERVRGVINVIPSKYLSTIQITRTDLEAQAAGETIRDGLLEALQGAGDEPEEEEGIEEVGA